mgnify:CR=1 FL=1
MAGDENITLYTTDPCGFCRSAKALLESRGVSYEEVNLAKDPEGRGALVARPGADAAGWMRPTLYAPTVAAGAHRGRTSRR